MSKKSKRKNNLKLSILLLILLLILLISSTYAWFTANKIVTISTIDVNIAAQNGLQISTDAVNWKAVISNEDITTAYSGHHNAIPAGMEPVSTVGEINAGDMLMYYGVVEPDTDGKYKLTATVAPEGTAVPEDETQKFIAFDIFLKVNDDVNLKMTKASTVKHKGEPATDQGIKNATRVAFCIEGNRSVTTPVNEITALAEATSFIGGDPKSVYIWEPNANWHTEAARIHAEQDYEGAIDPFTTDGTAANFVPYYGIKQPITTPVLLKDTYTESADFAAVAPDWQSVSEADGSMTTATSIFPLTAGITKVRVYMWVEGQDVDCENEASGTNILFDLQLAVDDGSEPTV